MAKTESTAINQLIQSVQSGSPPAPAPADDLLFQAPKPPSKPPTLPTSTRNPHPARMTSTIPPMRGAGEVQPLPRGRAPTGTSQHQLPKVPPPVRVTTAPPTRSVTIPPLPKAAAPAVPDLPKLPKPSLPPPTRTAPPPTTPVAAPFPAKKPEPPAPPVADETNPFVAKPRPQTLDETGDVVSADMWFEPSRMVDRVEDEAWLGTAPAPKVQPRSVIIKKMIAPMIVLVVLGVAIGGYFAFNGERQVHHKTQPTKVAAVTDRAQHDVTTAIPPSMSPESGNAATASAGAEQPQPPAPATAPAEPAPAPAAVPAPAPAAVPAPAPAAVAAPAAEPAPVHEVKTTQGVVKLVDVRIDSHPTGATVMLVDNGKTSFLGTTPVEASIDPSRGYDVILTLEGRTTQMAHLDPAKSHHLDIALVKGSAQAKAAAAVAKVETPAPAPVPAPAPAKPAHHAHAATRPVAALAEPSFTEAPAPAPAPAAKPSGKGTLMVSSKPPCEIYIDGQPTGLTTPQRSIAMSVGAHKITFVNAGQNVKKTVAVSIRAGEPTKLIQNFMPE